VPILGAKNSYKERKVRVILNFNAEDIAIQIVMVTLGLRVVNAEKEMVKLRSANVLDARRNTQPVSTGRVGGCRPFTVLNARE